MSNELQAPKVDGASEPEITTPNKLILWMFVVCFAGIAAIIIWDLVTGLMGR